MPNKIKKTKTATKATLDEVLKAVNSNKAALEDVVDAVNNGFTNMEERLTKVETRLTGVETRLTKVESQMVTKEYLDDKMADLRGDLVVMVRKEDMKLKKLVDILEHRQLISTNERESIFALEPFAQN